MEPIEPGKDKKTFLNDIEEKIYNEIDRLN